MQDLARHRCLGHPEREAVARCPQCHQFFCRECIAEHDDQVICASCLRKISRAGAGSKYGFKVWAQTAVSFGGILLAMFFFYLLGQALLSIPATFHDGTVWQTSVWND